MQQRTSLLTEILWLLYFLAIFVIFVYLLNIFVVPHHFNDKIAVMVSAIVAALAMITTRAWAARRAKAK